MVIITIKNWSSLPRATAKLLIDGLLYEVWQCHETYIAVLSFSYTSA